jgi:hypothetical protein
VTETAVVACQWCAGSKKRVVTHAHTGELHGMPCACQADLPIPFIYQPDDYGCGIAAVAMATCTPYPEVRRLLVMSNDLSGVDKSGGVNVGQVDDLIDHLGFAWRARAAHVHRLASQRTPWPCQPFADTHVVYVRNLSDNAHHFVCLLRDGRVLDPWWGVINGLHRYPMVHSIKGLFRIDARVEATTT